MLGKILSKWRLMVALAAVIPSMAYAGPPSKPESIVSSYWDSGASARLSVQAARSNTSSFDDVDRKIYMLHQQSLIGNQSTHAQSVEKDLTEALAKSFPSPEFYHRATCGSKTCEVVVVLLDGEPRGEAVRSAVLRLNRELKEGEGRYEVLTPSVITEGPDHRGVSALYYLGLR